MPSRIRPMPITLAICVLLYFITSAILLRFALARLVLPAATTVPITGTPASLRVEDSHGNTLLLRRYGEAKAGCVVFFPGQHGLIPRYEKELFPTFVAKGIAVFAAAYPGQNGTPGKPNLPAMIQLASKAVTAVQTTCPDQHVVVYGRSLGAMVAAYAAKGSHPSGLIIESAAPSLATAIDRHLAAHWYLAPLRWLPLSRVVEHNYSLSEALAGENSFPTVLFQGTADRETPLMDLHKVIFPSNFELIEVIGGEHSDTYTLASNELGITALRMMEEANGLQNDQSPDQYLPLGR